jgi:competence protein ComER
LKIGIVGTGNMGTILLEALLEAKGVKENDLIITNRTFSKALAIREKYPDITVVESAVEVTNKAEAIFICVKPLEVYQVLQAIKHDLTQNQCVISITSPISLVQLESQVNCSCARLIPSITNRALAGVSLLSFGNSCSPDWAEKITGLASLISMPVVIDNTITRAASDIVSCGPAFFSYLARCFIEAACETTKIEKQTASILTEYMLIGLGELLKKEIYTLPTLQEKVCVKGGITGEGIKVLESETGDMFQHLFQATKEKFKEDIEEAETQFDCSYE